MTNKTHWTRQPQPKNSKKEKKKKSSKDKKAKSEVLKLFLCEFGNADERVEEDDDGEPRGTWSWFGNMVMKNRTTWNFCKGKYSLFVSEN